MIHSTNGTSEEAHALTERIYIVLFGHNHKENTVLEKHDRYMVESAVQEALQAAEERGAQRAYEEAVKITEEYEEGTDPYLTAQIRALAQSKVTK